jgi:hypothetical protein
MTVFTPALTGSQSSDGKTLTITDLSNYSVNSQGYTISDFTTRQVVLTSSDGTVLATLNLGISLTITWQIVKDQYIKATLNLAGVAPYSTFINLPLQRNTRNLYRVLLQGGCCQNKTIEQKLAKADIYFRGSDIEELAGNGPAFDRDIFTINSYLNS